MVDIHPDARFEINKITAERAGESLNRRTFMKAGLGFGGTMLGLAAYDGETNTVTKRNDGTYDKHMSGRNVGAVGLSLAGIATLFFQGVKSFLSHENLNSIRNAQNRFDAPYDLRALKFMTEDERVDIVHKYHPELSRDEARDLLLTYEAERVARKAQKDADAEAGAAFRAKYDPKTGWPKPEAAEPKDPS